MSIDYSLKNSLEDMETDLLRHMAQLLMVFSGLGIYLTLPEKPYPYTILGLLLCTLIFGGAIYLISKTQLVWARRIFVWGLNVALIGGMVVLNNPWLPFLGLLLPLISSLLVSRSGLITTVNIIITVLWLDSQGYRDYPIVELVLLLLLSFAIAWRTVNMLYTALIWYSTTQQEAKRLLAETRDNRAELAQTLKSLEIAYDIRSRMQHELMWLRQQSEEAQRMKERFAANISHELRTPLNLILGFSEVMHLSPEVYGEIHWPPTLRRDIYQIYQSSRLLLDMIDDILDLSHFEMSSFTIDLQPTALDSFLTETVEIAHNIFRDARIDLRVDIESKLPIVDIDRTRIRQALINLLNNARRFTEQGFVNLKVFREQDEVIFSVSDTGRGIPQDKLDHIFNEFYQIDYSLSRKHGGAGLGLSITKRFVEAHKGRIWVESKPDEGSQFAFTIPITARGNLKIPNEIIVKEPSPCVLVVDPDPSVTDRVSRNLEGFTIIQVDRIENIHSAIEIYSPWAVIHNVPPHELIETPMLPVPYYQCSLPSQFWLTGNLTVAAYLSKPIESRQIIAQIDAIENVRRILIIDGDRGFIQLMRRIIELYDHDIEILHAYESQDGVAKMHSHSPDVVLLDLSIDDDNGIHILNEITAHERLRSIPVLLITASNHRELIEKRNPLIIQRPGGLYPSDILHCLRATLKILKPNHQDWETYSNIAHL